MKNSPDSSVALKRRAFVSLVLCLTLCFGVVAPIAAHGEGGASFFKSLFKKRSKKGKERKERESESKERAEREAKSKRGEKKEEFNEAREEIEGDPDARAKAFLFERMYPFNEIPAEARRRAWESRPDGYDAGGGKGLFKTRADATAPVWRAIGPVPTTPRFTNWGTTSGRVNAIAVSPANPNIVLIGAVTGGIWRSTDGGATFAPTTDNQVDLAVGSIAFSKSNPSIVYAGMGDALGNGSYVGTGVLKSTDAGQTWTRVSNSTLPAPGNTVKIDVDPTDANRVYVSQYTTRNTTTNQLFSSGFFVSTDGGVNWTLTRRGLPRDFVISPQNPQTIFLGMNRVDPSSEGIAPGILRSTDGGQTWTSVYASTFASPGDVRLAVSAAAPQRVYGYLGQRGSGLKVVVTDDNGANWSERSVTGLDAGQFGYNSYIAADPSNADTVFIGARDVFKSTDGGKTWTNITKTFDFTKTASGDYNPEQGNAHPDHHSFAFTPNNPSAIFIGHDGGLSKSTDGGKTFTSPTTSLSITQFIGLSIHPTDPAITYGGTQDNGTQSRSGTTTGWTEISEGDGGNSVVYTPDPSVVYTTYIYGNITGFTNNGTQNRTQITNNKTFGEDEDNPRINFYAPFVGNGVDGTLYFGTWRLFVSKDKGENWTAPGGTTDLTKGDGDVLEALAVSRSNTQIIYTGSAQGRAMHSDDGGKTWTDVTSNLPDRTIKSIYVDPQNPATALLTVSGYGSGHVFRTTNSGQSWTDLSGTAGASNALPNVPANAVLIDPKSASTIYVGTDIGMFRSIDSGATWQTFNKRLPPVIVNAIVAQTAQNGGRIVIGTYGRGAYELAAPVTANQIDDATFFVTQHYLDFLNRQPDAAGLQFWTNQINSCNGNAQCIDIKRQNVSAAYFVSVEFQQTGYLVYKLWKAAYGNITGKPAPVRFGDFIPDVQTIGQGVVVGADGWEAKLEANKRAFLNQFVARSAFTQKYSAMSNAQYVATLNANAGNALSASDVSALVAGLDAGTETRASALRKVAENATFDKAEFSNAFVLMQYFGYLRRDPDAAPDKDFAGYNFWLNKLNSFNGDYIASEMIRSFIVSQEYRQRFGTP